MILVLAIFASSMFTPNLLDDFTGEGAAAEGADLVSKRFDIASAPTESLVSSNPSLDVDSPLFRITVEGLVQQLRALSEVDSVASYYDTNAPGWYRATSAS